MINQYGEKIDDKIVEQIDDTLEKLYELEDSGDSGILAMAIGRFMAFLILGQEDPKAAKKEFYECIEYYIMQEEIKHL